MFPLVLNVVVVPTVPYVDEEPVNSIEIAVSVPDVV